MNQIERDLNFFVFLHTNFCIKHTVSRENERSFSHETHLN
jgi:hypothetical protein